MSQMYKNIVGQDQPLDEELPHGFIIKGQLQIQHVKEVLEKVLKSKSRKHYEFKKRDFILYQLFKQGIVGAIRSQWKDIDSSDIDFNIIVPNCNHHSMQITVIVKKTLKIYNTLQYAVFSTNYIVDVKTGIMTPI
jgi:hypothetical protein